MSDEARIEATDVERKKPGRWKRRPLKFLLALIAVAIAFVSWRLWVTRGSEAAVGIYMTGDGQSYVVVEQGRFGGLRVPEGQVVTEFASWANDGDSSVDARFRHGRLILVQEQFARNAGGRRCDRKVFHFVFEPSSTRPGDWDLVEAAGERSLSVDGAFWREAIIQAEILAHEISEAVRSLGGHARGRPWTTERWELSPSKAQMLP